jgi:hypothetical protein
MAYALIQWVFDYPNKSDGYGFPFDHAHLDFYRRIQKVYILLGQIKEKTYSTMVAQIDKYWEKLFADPIPIVCPDGVVRNIFCVVQLNRSKMNANCHLRS